MNFTGIVASATQTIKKHGPEILTGLGIAGMIATTVMAVRATPKALKLCEELRLDRVNDYEAEPTKIEYVKAAWKCYIPATVTGVMSVVCLIGASSVNTKRNAALATAYTITETAFRDYKDKVVETIGEKKEREVRDAVIKDKIDAAPKIDDEDIIVTGNGNTLCYDLYGGRYFRSSMEALKRAVNDLNEALLTDGYVSLNDFYDHANLDPQKRGDDLGWDTRNGQVRLYFSSQLAWGHTPCLVLDFSVEPRYDYYH